MFKNILSLIFALLLTGVIAAQSKSSPKNQEEVKRQLAIESEEVKQFEEKVQSFEKALTSDKAADINALKLMIEQAMLTDIRQSRNGATTSSRRSTRNEAGSRTERYQEKQRADKAVIIADKQRIYERFAAIEELEGINLGILDKLTLEFYELMEEDLARMKEEQRVNY